MYAISSAALAYTLARACSGGSLHHCTCASPPGDPPGVNFKWGGCGDNLKWAKNFAKRFLDNAEKKQMVGTKVINNGDYTEDEALAKYRNRVITVNLHNNRVGRKVSCFKIKCERFTDLNCGLLGGHKRYDDAM